MKTIDFFREKLKLHYIEVIIPFYLSTVKNFSHRQVHISRFSDLFEKGDFFEIIKSSRKSVWDWFLEEAYYSKGLWNKIIWGFDHHEPQVLSPYNFYAEIEGRWYFITQEITWDEFVTYASELAKELKFWNGKEKNLLEINDAKLVKITRYDWEKFISVDNNNTKLSDTPKRDDGQSWLKHIWLSITERQDGFMRANEDDVVVINWPAWSGKTNILLHRLDYFSKIKDISSWECALFCFNLWLKKYLLESVKLVLSAPTNVYSIDKWKFDILNEIASTSLVIDFKWKLENMPNFHDVDRYIDSLLSSYRLENIVNLLSNALGIWFDISVWTNFGKFPNWVSIFELHDTLLDIYLKKGHWTDSSGALMSRNERVEFFNQKFIEATFIIERGTREQLPRIGLLNIWKHLCDWSGRFYNENELALDEVHYILIYVCRKFLWALANSGNYNHAEPFILKNFQHIMVDEFQDLRKYQLYVIRQFSKGWMTIAWDITQSIFLNPEDWEIDFGFSIDQILKLDTSHRSTLQTILFANSILWKNENYVKSEKVVYTWDKPIVFELENLGDLIWILKLEIKKYHKSSFLLACATKESCEKWNITLNTNGIESYIGEKHSWDFKKHFVVATYQQIKGLEFDFVFVMDLPEFTSREWIENKENILYTVFTRARNRVSIVYEKYSKWVNGFLSKIDPELYEYRTY